VMAFWSNLFAQPLFFFFSMQWSLHYFIYDSQVELFHLWVDVVVFSFILSSSFPKWMTSCCVWHSIIGRLKSVFPSVNQDAEKRD
jgi:hypothetical protein